MKTQAGIWLDGEKALVVGEKDGEYGIDVIQSELENRIYHMKEGDRGTFKSGGQHHIDEKKFDERRKHQMESYLGELVDTLMDTEEIYIMGPGITKKLLLKNIEARKDFTGVVLAMEPADKMTDNELIARVRKFFS